MEQHTTQTNQDVEQFFPHVSGDTPLLPLKNAVIYPYIVMPIAVNGDEAIQLIRDVASGQKIIGVVAQRSSEVEYPKTEDLFSVGTLVKIVKTFQTKEGGLHVLLQGLSRMKIVDYVQEQPHYIARVEMLRDSVQVDRELNAMMSNVKSLVTSVVQLGYNMPEELQLVLANVDNPGILADMVAETPGFSLLERQELLEMTDVKQRLHRVTGLST